MILNFILILSAGLLTASWGAFKDSPYENFSLKSFLRSIVITSVYYYLLFYLLKDYKFFSHPISVAFSAVALERLNQEYWKAFFRPKQREKIYKIPQSFHVMGKVMEYKKRLVLGIILTSISIMTLSFLIKIKIDHNSWIIPGLLLSILPSIGGAWKDAPIEGFDIKKFPRSFLIMFFSIFILSRVTDNLLILVLGAAGLERLLVEFYKSFLILSTPGKFNPKVNFPEWKEKRKVFIYSYTLAAIVLIISSFLIK